MQTDKDLFDLMKETYPMNPRPDFVSDTELHLRKAVRKINRKRTYKLISIASSGFLACVIAVLWIFSSSGKEVIDNKLSSFLENNNSSSAVNNQEHLIYIYHSHNQESFISETKTKDPSEAFHQSKNITLVGQRLSQDLNKKNIKTMHENSDIMGVLKERGLSFDQSYSVSREFLAEKLKDNPSIKMVFDIHRDSRKRSETTIKINGKDYARITFIISNSSINYEENLKFAEQQHKKMEEKYPGLSRGVVLKDNADTTKNTYNQDLIKESVLMDIGGIENTLEEEYRTVDVFAEVIEEILKTEK